MNHPAKRHGGGPERPTPVSHSRPARYLGSASRMRSTRRDWARGL